MKRTDHHGRPRRRTGRQTARRAVNVRRAGMPLFGDPPVLDADVVHEVFEDARDVIGSWLADSFYRPSTAREASQGGADYLPPWEGEGL